MEIVNRKLLVGLSAGVLLLAACGGGSDDGAGQLSDYQVQPTEINLATGNDNCPGYNTIPAAPVKAGEFLIIGGTAPYTVSTAFTDRVYFGAPLASAPTHEGSYVVSNRNQRVSVFVIGCLSPGSITILDNQNRVLNASVTAASGAGT